MWILYKSATTSKPRYSRNKIIINSHLKEQTLILMFHDCIVGLIVYSCILFSLSERFVYYFDVTRLFGPYLLNAFVMFLWGKIYLNLESSATLIFLAFKSIVYPIQVRHLEGKRFDLFSLMTKPKSKFFWLCSSFLNNSDNYCRPLCRHPNIPL